MSKEYTFVITRRGQHTIPKQGYILKFNSYEDAKNYEKGINQVFEDIGIDSVITLLDRNYITEHEFQFIETP